MKIRQSRHGFILRPYPYLGFLMMPKYSLLTSNTLSLIPNLSAADLLARHVFPFAVHVQNTVTKLRASSSIPCFRTSFVAKILSNPPDNNAIALVICVL